MRFATNLTRASFHFSFAMTRNTYAKLYSIRLSKFTVRKLSNLWFNSNHHIEFIQSALQLSCFSYVRIRSFMHRKQYFILSNILNMDDSFRLKRCVFDSRNYHFISNVFQIQMFPCLLFFRCALFSLHHIRLWQYSNNNLRPYLTVNDRRSHRELDRDTERKNVFTRGWRVYLIMENAK